MVRVLDIIYLFQCTFANAWEFRGINEGRQCAREVDYFFTGAESHLPVTGGIIKSSPLKFKDVANGAPKEIIISQAA